jgi:type IV pilus assembly protein PilQ
MKRMKQTSMIATLAFAVVIGFTTGLPGRAESADEISKPKLAAIQSVSQFGEGSSVELVIKLSSSATYTSYKTTAPLRLVIDFSQTTQGAVNARIPINKGNFKAVTVNRYDTDAGVLTRMNIELVNDAEAVITASATDPGELRVSFPVAPEKPPVEVEKSAPVKPVAIEVPPASSTVVTPKPPASPPEAFISALTSITAEKNTITLTLDGAVGDIKSFRLSDPDRYVVDLMNVRCGFANRLIPLNIAGIASARIGIYTDKTRIVFDAVNGSFPGSTIVKMDSAVVITLDVKAAMDNPDHKPASARSEPPPEKVPEKAKEKAAPVKAAAVTPPEPAVAPAVTSSKAVKSTGPSSVEMIDFQVVNGISRVSVKVVGDVYFAPPVKSAGYVTFTLKNVLLPKSLQRSLDAHSFNSPVLRVTPFLVKNRKGSDTKIRIAMRVAAPFEIRQEGDMLFVDFKNPDGLTAEKLAAETTDQIPQVSKAKASQSQDPDITAELARSNSGDSSQKSSGPSRVYTGRKVTLEFADAEVRKIFQLLSEVSNKNFVLGDDVTGNISLKLVNVPWDQALEIILETKDLDSREAGNVLTIKKKGRFKSQADEELEIKKTLAKGIELKTETFTVNYSDVATISGQFNALKSERGIISTDARTGTVIVKDIPMALDDMRKLLAQLDVPERQVMIEARIVEASSTFTRSLGVNWGMHYRDGSASFMGINQLDTSFGGLASAAPTTGANGQSGGTMGISFGTLSSNISIDLRLNAAAGAGLVKIISSPKVATLNHKTAKISQGQQIPYQNTTATTGAVTAFVAATLSLEVTPHINANGTIVMKIDAKNDAPGTGSPPPINTKQATTELLLKDGETTVIGGIFVDSETDGDDGVPYLMDVPLLGNLFRSSAKSKIKTELLIFITPRILGSN